MQDLLETSLDGAVGNDVLSDELQQFVRQHWASIRTSAARGPVQSRYNYRLTTLDTRDLEGQLRRVFDEQTYSFKINMSYGFILRNKHTVFGCTQPRYKFARLRSISTTNPSTRRLAVGRRTTTGFGLGGGDRDQRNFFR